jgi:ABC-type transporter Mla subunit MlaD
MYDIDYLHAIHPIRDLVHIAKSVPPVVDSWAQSTNQLSQWVVTEVVLTSNPKQRVALIKRLYIIAEVC